MSWRLFGLLLAFEAFESVIAKEFVTRFGVAFLAWGVLVLESLRTLFLYLAVAARGSDVPEGLRVRCLI